MDLNLEELTTLMNALDRYIGNEVRDQPSDFEVAISLHNRLLDAIKAEYPDAGILKPYHNYL